MSILGGKYSNQYTSKRSFSDDIFTKLRSDEQSGFCIIQHWTKSGRGLGLGLTHNSWFNSGHGLFSPLTPIINTNTLSLKHLINILPAFNLKIDFYMP